MSFPLVKSLVILTAAATLTIQPALAADKVKIPLLASGGFGDGLGGGAPGGGFPGFPPSR